VPATTSELTIDNRIQYVSPAPLWGLARRNHSPDELYQANLNASTSSLPAPDRAKTTAVVSAVLSNSAHLVEAFGPGSNGGPQNYLLFNRASETRSTPSSATASQKPFSTATKPKLVLATPNLPNLLAFAQRTILENYLQHRIRRGGTGRAYASDDIDARANDDHDRFWARGRRQNHPDRQNEALYGITVYIGIPLAATSSRVSTNRRCPGHGRRTINPTASTETSVVTSTDKRHRQNASSCHRSVIYDGHTICSNTGRRHRYISEFCWPRQAHHNGNLHPRSPFASCDQSTNWTHPADAHREETRPRRP